MLAPLCIKRVVLHYCVLSSSSSLLALGYSKNNIYHHLQGNHLFVLPSRRAIYNFRIYSQCRYPSTAEMSPTEMSSARISCADENEIPLLVSGKLPLTPITPPSTYSSRRHEPPRASERQPTLKVTLLKRIFQWICSSGTLLALLNSKPHDPQLPIQDDLTH
jgi:hypothetical protein